MKLDELIKSGQVVFASEKAKDLAERLGHMLHRRDQVAKVELTVDNTEEMVAWQGLTK